MTLQNKDRNTLRALLPLRPSGDLTDEEVRQVDEGVRYSDELHKELESFESCLTVLRSASLAPTAADDRPSLWNRLEPRLGPAGRLRPRRFFSRISTRQLALACAVLAALDVGLNFAPSARRSGPLAGNARIQSPVPQVVGNRSTAPRDLMFVDPCDERGIVRPVLGVAVHSADADGKGAVVGAVIPGTAADEAGLQRDDVIVSLNDRSVGNSSALIDSLQKRTIGEKVLLQIRRGREALTIPVVLGGRVRVGDQELLLRPPPSGKPSH